LPVTYFMDAKRYGQHGFRVEFLPISGLVKFFAPTIAE
jgi:hypothetical protein